MRENKNQLEKRETKEPKPQEKEKNCREGNQREGNKSGHSWLDTKAKDGTHKKESPHSAKRDEEDDK